MTKKGDRKGDKAVAKIEKRLAAARATESKRLHQLERAEGSQHIKRAAKRRRQADEAAIVVAALASDLAHLTVEQTDPGAQAAAAEASGAMPVFAPPAPAVPPVPAVPVAAAPRPRAPATRRAATAGADAPSAGAPATASSSSRRSLHQGTRADGGPPT